MIPVLTLLLNWNQFIVGFLKSWHKVKTSHNLKRWVFRSLQNFIALNISANYILILNWNIKKVQLYDLNIWLSSELMVSHLTFFAHFTCGSKTLDIFLILSNEGLLYLPTLYTDRWPVPALIIVFNLKNFFRVFY